jgi:universal stress protein A
MVFKRILVPLDFTDKNLRALEVAQQIAVQYGASVALLHVIEVIENLPFEELSAFYRKLEDAARARMAYPVSLFLEKQLVVEPEVVYGSRAEEIVRYAAANEVDLVILSSHRLDVARPAPGWGTISHKVAILSQCPVLLVK